MATGIPVTWIEATEILEKHGVRTSCVSGRPVPEYPFIAMLANGSLLWIGNTNTTSRAIAQVSFTGKSPEQIAEELLRKNPWMLTENL